MHERSYSLHKIAQLMRTLACCSSTGISNILLSFLHVIPDRLEVSSFTVVFTDGGLKRGEKRGSPREHSQESTKNPGRFADDPRRQGIRFPFPRQCQGFLQALHGKNKSWITTCAKNKKGFDLCIQGSVVFAFMNFVFFMVKSYCALAGCSNAGIG